MKKYSLIILSFLFISLIFSCKKDKIENSTITTEDEAVAFSTYLDVFKVFDVTMQKERLDNYKINNTQAQLNSPTVTVVNLDALLPYPKEITIDFGAKTDTCIWFDGPTRSGKIIANISAPYLQTGSEVKIKFEEYYIDGKKVEGEQKIKNIGRNSSAKMQFETEVIAGIITKKDGEKIDWACKLTSEWYYGEETKDATSGFSAILDDEYYITGTVTGTDSEDRSYTGEIKTPLYVNLGCRWVKSGTVNIKPSDVSERTLIYGNGECDEKAIVTIGTHSYEIYIR